MGRPPHEVRRYYADFRYRAGSWTKSRRVVAKVEWDYAGRRPARRPNPARAADPARGAGWTRSPSDVIALVVLWRLRYKLSLRDLTEMFLVRGLVFSHEAVREWEAKLTPALAEDLRRRRRGHIGRSWYVDETIQSPGQWRYLYRAVDRDGALVDVMLSERRDLAAAKAFFRSARTVTGVVPDRVTTDGHDAYPAAIRSELGEAVRHRTNVYLNNRLEQDHRGIKDRYRPMRGFKSVTSAGRFCRAFDEVRSFLRVRAFIANMFPPIAGDCVTPPHRHRPRNPRSCLT